MAEKSLCTFVDYARSNPGRAVFSNRPTRSSHGKAWNGLHLLSFQQPAWATPEFSAVQHVIGIHTQVSAGSWLERMIDGCRKVEILQIGDIVVIPATAPRTACWNQELEFVVLALEPAHFQTVAYDFMDVDRVELIPTFAKADPLVYQIGQALIATLDTDSINSCLYVEAMTMALSAHLLRYYSSHKPLSQIDETTGLSRTKLRQAINYIHDHLTDNLSLAAIAAELGMSCYHFARLFKQSTGISPYRYITQCRVETAKRLLALPNLSITRISEQLGFAETSQFSKFFRKQTGISPRKYRQERSVYQWIETAHSAQD